MTLALELSGVAKRYGEVQAVRDLSFEVEAGSIFGFLGPNGAGKTTTLRMVLGLIPPTSGRVAVLGASDPTAVRDRIGFLPEERGLYRRMTPLEAVVFFGGLKGMTTARAKARGTELLEGQGLGDAMRRPMKALSKGMAQKVQLICALVHEPELVILDEPFSGLDPLNQQGLERLIRELAGRGATVVFSTHVMAHAERLCRRIVLMARGAKVFDGTVDEARAAAGPRLALEGAVTRGQALALPGVAAVEGGADGPGRLTLALTDGADPKAILRAAFERGLELTEFQVQRPSLHDAFILLTERAA